MEVTTSIREEDGKTQVTVTVPAADVKKHIDAEFKQMSKARIPGFRPGRAPRKIIEQNFGGHEAVYQEITTNLINDVAPLAVDSKDLIFISNPEFEDSAIVVDGEDFTFTMTAKVKPSVQLLTYDPVEIKMPVAGVTDEDVNVQIDSLRSYYYSFQDVEGRAAQNGDYATVDTECTNAGEKVQGLCSKGRFVELGAGTMPSGFEAGIVGMNPGESKEFEFTIAGDPNWGHLESDTVQASVTLVKIQEKALPEADDEFAKKIGCETMEELRKMISEAVDKQKAEQLPALKERRCLTELAKRVYGDVPQAYVNYTRTETLRDFYNNLQRNGITFDQFLSQQGITAEEFQADLEEEAKEVAGQNLALDALAAHLNIEVTDADIDEEFSVVEDPAATRKQWEEAGRMAEIREGVLRRKAAEWLTENAVVTEDDGTEESEDEE